VNQKTSLLATEDELVTTFLGEVLIGEEVLAPFEVILSFVFVLLRNPVKQIVLQ
jgi:hypothetical protein